MDITHDYLKRKYGSEVFYKALEEMVNDKEIPLVVQELDRLCKKKESLLTRNVKKILDRDK